MRLSGLATVLLSGLALALPQAALALSDEELLQLFQKQREMYRAATMSGGKTRGLELVAPEEPVVSADAPGLATPGTDSEMTALSTGDGTVKAGTAPGGLAAPTADTTAVADATTVAPASGPLVVLDNEFQVFENIKFDFDSAALRADQKPQLEQLCRVMKGSDINLFKIVGHTDSSGSAEYNNRLSLMRAEEVKRYFVNDCGIDAARLDAVGVGERFPRVQDDPKASENRRVEFQAIS